MRKHVAIVAGLCLALSLGATGQVSVVFGVSTQTPLSGVSDLKTLSADLVMRDNDHLTETVGSVHVDVTI